MTSKIQITLSFIMWCYLLLYVHSLSWGVTQLSLTCFYVSSFIFTLTYFIIDWYSDNHQTPTHHNVDHEAGKHLVSGVSWILLTLVWIRITWDYLQRRTTVPRSDSSCSPLLAPTVDEQTGCSIAIIGYGTALLQGAKGVLWVLRAVSVGNSTIGSRQQTDSLYGL